MLGGTDMQPEQPELRNDQEVQGLPATPRSEPPLKIGGVLILVAIGLILSLVQNLGHFLGNLAPFRQAQVWERLTTPGSTAYHPNWKPVLLFELVSSSAIFGLNAVAVALFFRKQRVFPKFIVMVIPLIFILILLGYYLSGLIPAVAESPDYSKQTAALIVRFVALHVWIPYFLLSERVKKTFVK
jgi:ABC-type Na+ efflux pump permease subunit